MALLELFRLGNAAQGEGRCVHAYTHRPRRGYGKGFTRCRLFPLLEVTARLRELKVELPRRPQEKARKF